MHTAIRFHPPSYDIRVEQIPAPKICDPDDAIVKVQFAGLCGSDLHVYRGHEAVDQIHTCGHEFIGEIVELGSNFDENALNDRPRLYSTLKVGHKVVSPFTINCGECQFCRLGITCRCLQSKLFGSPSLEGAQAQYVRVPMAGGTLFNLSDPALEEKYANLSSITDSSLLFLGDILPTGLFAAVQALHHPKLLPAILGTPWPDHLVEANPSSAIQSDDTILTFAVIGLGPVGVCTVIALLDQLAKKQLRYRIVGIDLLQSRREKMTSIYEMVNRAENYTLGTFVAQGVDEAKVTVQEWTSGVGCNAVLEIVGHNSALALAYDLVRPFGVISSVGVHGERPFPLTGGNLYDKNVSLDFGRCPARSMLPMAFDLLVKRQDVFGGVGGESSLVDRIVGFEQAVDLYSAFDKGEVGKILFDPWKQ
ncbi:chaperonin 10-like protein [Mucidula mucida]|nr:chaperonin 10-like protein [Mucidula mucida]